MSRDESSLPLLVDPIWSVHWDALKSQVADPLFATRLRKMLAMGADPNGAVMPQLFDPGRAPRRVLDMLFDSTRRPHLTPEVLGAFIEAGADLGQCPPMMVQLLSEQQWEVALLCVRHGMPLRHQAGRVRTCGHQLVEMASTPGAETQIQALWLACRARDEFKDLFHPLPQKNYALLADELVVGNRHLDPEHMDWWLDQLLELGESLNHTDPHGRTVLFGAAAAHVPLLIARGISVTHADKEGRTALHLAACGHEGTQEVQALLAVGAELSAVDHQGNTVLHYAVDVNALGNRDAKDSATLMIYLIEAGVDPHQRNHAGLTARDLAWSSGHQTIYAPVDAHLSAHALTQELVGVAETVLARRPRL